MNGQVIGTKWQHRPSMLAWAAVIDLEGEILEGAARRLREALAGIDGPVLLRINSGGGLATEGAALAQVVQAYPQITTYGAGVVASAATLPFCAAKRAALSPLTSFMIHDPMTLAAGAAADLRQTADALDTIATTYAEFYAKRAGVSLQTARGWMEAETWLTPTEAVALRLADAVEDFPDAPQPARADYTRFPNAPAALVQLARMNGWTAAPSEQNEVSE